MTRTKLTDKQRAILEDGANGLNVQGRWQWTIKDGGTRIPVTREVKALEKRKLVHCGYYTGGTAGCSATVTVEATLAQWKRETQEITIRRGDDSTARVLRADYVTAKTKDLRAFGYPDLTEKEVEEQLVAILAQQELSVIGRLMEDDIVITEAK